MSYRLQKYNYYLDYPNKTGNFGVLATMKKLPFPIS